ncbi:MAG: DUF1553 domain-containing protein [Fuerstiella sp.]|nr:DUF1553 domain-containing protein [Fuerstiella sp.]MDG2128129.1 DUF1553 domain-containing protein [Fuerstiella sp.]
MIERRWEQHRHRFSVVCGITLSVFSAVIISSAATAAEISFNRDIRPILSDVCFKCHGPDEQQRVGEFRLDTKAGAFGVVEDGHALVPHDVAGSLLFQKITSSDPDAQMPPPDSGRKLSARQVELLRQWIVEGAPWQEHWAFIPPQKPPLPAIRASGWCRNPIDHFVLARLEREGLQPSVTADRRTLIRRATLDLNGLPPTPEEVEAFVEDESSDAWSRVIDRLLRSPRYGETMAVGWLDAARYADTSGYQNDGPRDMWRWRDWVIDALNRNMPFDRFTVEQLAGDLLPGASISQQIATGFNRNHRGNAEGGIIPEEYQVEYVVDRVDTTATVWLGLTMGCARCHDHKYDPVTQKEFYQVFACFNNIPESGRAIKEGNSPPYIKAPTPEQQLALQRLDDRIASVELRVQGLQDVLHTELVTWEQSFSDKVDIDWTITDGLVNRFEFDGSIHDSADTPDKESAPAADVSAVQFGPGQHGQSAGFDGQQNVTAGDVANFGYFDRFSISMWMKPRQSTGTIVSRMVPVEQGSGYYVHLNDGHLQINLVKRWLDDSIRVESRDTLPLNEWQHITMTYDGSRVAKGIRAYRNGEPMELLVRYDGINQSFAADEPLRIGGGYSNFTGDIDDVQIYERALSQEDASRVAVPESISHIVAIEPVRRSPAQTSKLIQYFIQHHASDDLGEAYEEMVNARRDRETFYESIPTVMVMQEMEMLRPTHILTRGQYDAPAQKVTFGVPDVLPSLPDGAPHNRLGFARWLVEPGHPLTARVAVNRIWQMYFGTGLVKTTEDFGAQGDMPSHPDLLDWLATEFIRSGWDVKALHQVIVSSATYRQSSAVSAQLRDRDPENRLLARGPRFRLPAETVRDQTLFISGLLKEHVGGPSVRPYQPDGLWKEIASTTNYEQSHGDDLYRRSLYTYWKRTVAPPTMVTLDATARESCIVKRSRTNTPLQALALMNEVTFVEAARALAQRVMNESGDVTERRIDQAFRRVVSRLPTASERGVLLAAYARYLESFQNNPQAAEQLLSVGESPRDNSLNAVKLAAWTTVMSVILNLDEVVTKE